MSADLAIVESTLKNSTVTDRRYSAWLNRFAWFTAAATLFLICSGGMVTSKGVGLAVPDWPTTFGYNMFLFPVSKWIGGVFFEHTHRLIASTVGFLTIILAVWIWRSENQSLRNLGLIAVAGVVLQGILGGLRVTMLKDQIGIFHACLAQAFLGLIVFIALATTKSWQTLNTLPADSINMTGLTGHVSPRLARIKTIALVTTVAIYVQLALGAAMRHQHKDLAILDFPTANRAWIPDASAAALAKINAWRDAHAFSDVTASQIWLQMAHRFLALIIAVLVIVTCLRIWRHAKQVIALCRTSILWCVLLFLQLTLGAWVIWSNKAADVATAHVAIGATMLSFGVIITAICGRLSQQQERSTITPASAPAAVT
jgi:cytochrome c oxidase assembly protein subunit 15